MKNYILLRLTFGVLLLAVITAVSANAQTISAEDDTWITGSNTKVDFSNFGNINTPAIVFDLLADNFCDFVCFDIH